MELFLGFSRYITFVLYKELRKSTAQYALRKLFHYKAFVIWWNFIIKKTLNLKNMTQAINSLFRGFIYKYCAAENICRWLLRTVP